MAADEGRYLRYESFPPVVAGLSHQAANLSWLLREAHDTGRLAIMPPLRLAKQHNFGVARDWRWEDYFDFGASGLTDAHGHRHPLPIAARPPAPDAPTLRLRGGEAMPERARDYPVVTRRLSSPEFRKELPMGGWPAATVELHPSAAAVNLALPVIRHLRSLGDGGFVAVHIRRGDRVANGQIPDWLTSPPHIRRFLGDRGVADGAVVYIASDERNPDFWRPLRETYRLFRYDDFPPLNALISGAGQPPDNYLLFQAEGEVLRHGRLRIGTFPGLAWSQMDDWLISPEDWPRYKARQSFGRRARDRVGAFIGWRR